jgi:hypothetical protein
VEAAGIEREFAVLQRVLSQELTNSSAEVSAPCLHGERSTCQSLAAIDHELNRVLEIWSCRQDNATRKLKQ